MKLWNFKVKSNPLEISKKLDSAFRSTNGFIYSMDHGENDSIAFKVRKRVQFAFQVDNLTIINGKMLKTDTENEINVETYFIQHFLRRLYVSIFLVFGLLAIIMGISISATIFVIAGILIAIGIALWVDVQNKFKRDIQKYKTLISETLEL